MEKINCHIEIPEVAGLPSQELTVGREFLLICEDAALASEKAPVRLVTPPEKKYVLQILDQQKKDSQIRLKVTSYQTGAHDEQGLQLQVGTQSFLLSPQKWVVKSVLQQGQQPPPEPFGPFGPLKLSWPMSWWIFLGAMGLLLIFTGLLIYKKIQSRKRFLNELARLDLQGDAGARYFQTLRQVRRERGGGVRATELDQATARLAGQELDQALRSYLMQKMRIRAFDLSVEKLAKLLFDSEVESELQRLFVVTMTEIKQIQLTKLAQIPVQDFSQLIGECQSLVEKIEIAKKKGRSRGMA